METKKPICYARFLHACIGVPGLDIIVNDKVIAKSFDYRDFTEYFSAYPGIYHLTVYPAGKRDRALIDEHLEMDRDSIYTIAATGTAVRPDLNLISDQKRHMNQNRVHIRFINLSSINKVHIFLNDIMSVPNLSYHEVSDYIPVSSGAISIKVKDALTDGVILDDRLTSLKPSKIYAGYLTGSADGSNSEMQILTPLEGACHLQF